MILCESFCHCDHTVVPRLSYSFVLVERNEKTVTIVLVLALACNHALPFIDDNIHNEKGVMFRVLSPLLLAAILDFHSSRAPR
jgi:hypothetical protein